MKPWFQRQAQDTGCVELCATCCHQTARPQWKCLHGDAFRRKWPDQNTPAA